jgi:hypothetical protein
MKRKKLNSNHLVVYELCSQRGVRVSHGKAALNDEVKNGILRLLIKKLF